MRRFSVGSRLYISIMALFLVFAVGFIVFQQTREKQYKIDTLTLSLQDYNLRMHEMLLFQGRHDEAALSTFVRMHPERNLRVTLIDRWGNVFFDNLRKDYRNIGNHGNRREFQQALRTGMGATVERNSETLGQDYFYTATYFPQEGYVIRTALPYDADLAKSLQADQHYIWFALAAILLLTLLLYGFLRRLGRNITKLRIFAWRADHNESLETEELIDFPDDELGEIAERIIKIYKRLQTTRREQDILKRQLTQNIAHELKTPVASIQGFIETIIDNPDMDEDRRRQFLQRCHAQSIRLTALLQDISTLNRLDDAADVISFERVNITSMVSQIEKETALQLAGHDMTFYNRLPAELTVNGSRSLLYSIFRNLTDNAIAYAGQHTTITLEAWQDGDFWHFRFSDNGIGVAAEHLPRLFERFYRIDKGRSRKNGGTGLGLAIVKNAVLLHGGEISVSSNGGLTVAFTLRAFSSSNP
ncbi:MAG: HAMP domain-containing histidine kinase [Prevotella sp.]|nr:HAMP domain-containing histidine kinase [Prevotella sp.]